MSRAGDALVRWARRVVIVRRLDAMGSAADALTWDWP